MHDRPLCVVAAAQHSAQPAGAAAEPAGPASPPPVLPRWRWAANLLRVQLKVLLSVRRRHVVQPKLVAAATNSDDRVLRAPHSRHLHSPEMLTNLVGLLSSFGLRGTRLLYCHRQHAVAHVVDVLANQVHAACPDGAQSESAPLPREELCYFKHKNLLCCSYTLTETILHPGDKSWRAPGERTTNSGGLPYRSTKRATSAWYRSRCSSRKLASAALAHAG
jgi:hypothetical protein